VAEWKLILLALAVLLVPLLLAWWLLMRDKGRR
jgi:hypothetical protein